MPQLLHTLHCPLGFDLDLVVDLGLTENEYLDGLRAGEYRSVTDFSNWSEVMAGRPKPAFPLTDQSMKDVPMGLRQYIATSAVINDALDDLMETRHPNSKTR